MPVCCHSSMIVLWRVMAVNKHSQSNKILQPFGFPTLECKQPLFNRTLQTRRPGFFGFRVDMKRQGGWLM